MFARKQPPAKDEIWGQCCKRSLSLRKKYCPKCSIHLLFQSDISHCPALLCHLRCRFFTSFRFWKNTSLDQLLDQHQQQHQNQGQQQEKSQEWQALLSSSTSPGCSWNAGFSLGHLLFFALTCYSWQHHGESGEVGLDLQGGKFFNLWGLWSL